MLFSDMNQESVPSPPSRATTASNNVTQQQNGDCQQNSVMSPTTSSGCSPIACSSRLMSSLASTPVKKYNDSSPTLMKKHHDNSLLHQLLYNKMAAADQPQSPSITGGSPMAGTSPNMSFEFNGKIPANLSQTTVGTESLSSSSFLERSVLSPQRRMSNVFDALLNESSSSPCSLQSPLVPSIPSPLISCVSPSLQSPLVSNIPSPLILSLSNTLQSPPVRPTPAQSNLVERSNSKQPQTETKSQLMTPNHNESVRPKPRKSILELAERFRRLKMQPNAETCD
uniref:Uncharacterized protein n=1 Tax=Cacopsylla melanoneura TaxID=428564 RepID=A0A8D9AZA3_9HEMI